MNQMKTPQLISESDRYRRCINASKRVCWDIDRDVLKNRRFDLNHKFLPDGLSKAHTFTSLNTGEKRYLSQIQGRTYANMFGLVERFIHAKVIQLSGHHGSDDQIKVEALVRFGEEEEKHQDLFRRVEIMIAVAMPMGYRFIPQANPVAQTVLGKCTWSVLALTLLIELFTQSHYRQSIETNEELSPLFKDIFHYHWLEESQHAILDELEWQREDAKLSGVERDAAVNDFIELACAVDRILQVQAAADAEYFCNTNGRVIGDEEGQEIKANVLKAYRWQYIFSGAQHPQFAKVLGGMITGAHGEQINAALASMT